MGIIERVMGEVAFYEKHNGKKPGYIILGGWKDRFYSELYEYTIKNSGVKFENPIDGHRQFMGITLVNLKTTCGTSEIEMALGD